MKIVTVYACLFALTAGISAQTQAQAQTNAAALDNDGGIPEIVVTAQKREERINDVPLAISAIGEKELLQQGVRDTSDLARIVPGFAVQTSFFGSPVYYIRGVGFSDFTANTGPAVSIYVDEVPLPYSGMARGAVLDLERVEVLKGPQGTLFGESSTGGAVNYIAAKPTPDLHYGGDLSYGRFNDVNVDAFVSAPLADTLGIRVAVQSERQGDWQYSSSRPDDTRGQKNFLDGRVILAWKPAPGLNFDLSLQGWRDRSDVQTPQFDRATPQERVGGYAPALAALAAASPAPENDRATDWTPGDPKARDNTFVQVALRSTVDLSPTVSLTAVTGYSDFKLYQPMDGDGLAYRDLLLEERAHIEHFSQELRLAGSNGYLDWLVGGNYEHDTNTDVTHVTIDSTNNSAVGIVYDESNQINDNPSINTYAAFGSLGYKLTDTLTARGSVRYTSTHDNHAGCLADGGDGKIATAFSILSSIFTASPVAIGPDQCVTLSNATFKPAGLVSQSLDEDNVSWRTGLDWKLSPHSLLYANVAKGFKAGSFTSVPAVFDIQLAPVKQESVLAYEGGLKTNLLDNRAHLDLSAFYYDYKDKQLTGYVVIEPFGSLPTLVSIPKSRVDGLEAQLTVELTSLLQAQLSGTYLATKVLANPSVPTSPIGTPTSFIGESFPNASKYQANFDIEQRVPLSSGMEAYFGGDVTYRSYSSAEFGRNAGPLENQLYVLPSYTLLDLRVGLRFNNGNDLVELYGRNVTDRYYLNAITTSDATVRYTGMPATYGIRLSHRM